MQMGKLKAHMKARHPEGYEQMLLAEIADKPALCPICQKRFVDEKEVSTHVQIMHPGEDGLLHTRKGQKLAPRDRSSVRTKKSSRIKDKEQLALQDHNDYGAHPPSPPRSATPLPSPYPTTSHHMGIPPPHKGGPEEALTEQQSFAFGIAG